MELRKTTCGSPCCSAARGHAAAPYRSGVSSPAGVDGTWHTEMGVHQELGTPDRLRLDNDRQQGWPDANTPTLIEWAAKVVFVRPLFFVIRDNSCLFVWCRGSFFRRDSMTIHEFTRTNTNKIPSSSDELSQHIKGKVGEPPRPSPQPSPGGRGRKKRSSDRRPDRCRTYK